MFKYTLYRILILWLLHLPVYAIGSSLDLCKLAESTGGTCVPMFEEEKNQQEGSLYQQKIADIIARELINTVQPTITHAKPSQLSRGMTVDVIVEADKAHFNPNTQIQLGTGFTLNKSIFLSETQYILNITVADNVTLNSVHNITMTTVLNDGTEEIALGKGVLQVIKASTAPKILSITPSAINRDAAMIMTITGENTHFDENSDIQFWRAVGDEIEFDEDIEVRIIEVESSTVLKAVLNVKSDAWLGYHSIQVTTGDEVAIDNVIGPLDVERQNVSTIPKQFVVNDYEQFVAQLEQEETKPNTPNNQSQANNSNSNLTQVADEPVTNADEEDNIEEEKIEIAQIDDADKEGGVDIQVDDTNDSASSNTGSSHNTTSSEIVSNNEQNNTVEQSNQLGHIQFAQTEFFVSETANKLDIILSRVDGQDGELSIDYNTVSITADMAQDYWFANGHITWADQDATDKVLSIYLRDDLEQENSEQFQVQFIEADGHETRITIEIISDELPSLPYIPATCRTETRKINETCRTEGLELPNLQIITARGNISDAILSTEVINNGRVANIILTEEASLYGGIVSGYVVNQGLICDFDFRGAELAGGVLCGDIINTSADEVHGVIQDVVLASDTYIIGGELAGYIQGTESSPALLENLFVQKDSILSHVTIGKNVSFDRDVILENVSFTHEVEYLENVTLQGKMMATGQQHIVLKNGGIADNVELIGLTIHIYK
ncbi:Calx-beta domain-containing protein [Candidatus Albibeggiatoa sp. nov. NOAA]|uniref:Calx-beta domain-containing protein n=1 Tax=Candidatus Albibeggiatoa sp. nov. NOAA TaxID=3162724 RepID=UPI0032F3694F|nr:hypothetical protein [Thiotrichaceae bacterium]